MDCQGMVLTVGTASSLSRSRIPSCRSIMSWVVELTTLAPRDPARLGGSPCDARHPEGGGPSASDKQSPDAAVPLSVG